MDIAVQTEMNFKCLKVFAVEGSLCPCAKIKKKLWKRRKKRNCQRATTQCHPIEKGAKKKRFIHRTKSPGKEFSSLFFSVAGRVWQCAHTHTQTHTLHLLFSLASNPMAFSSAGWLISTRWCNVSLIVRDRVSSPTNGKHCLTDRWTPCSFSRRNKVNRMQFHR